jgi:hypothetical protein
LACLAAALLVLNGGQFLPADSPKDNNAADQPQAGKKNDRWQLGMKWVVETTTDLTQLGDNAKNKPQKTEPLQWQFTVTKDNEKVGGHECYRVEIVRLIGEGDQAKPAEFPVTTIWCDLQSLALRQIRTEFVVQGQVREVTESYDYNQPAPVLSPLTSIPLDMPVIRPGGATKALGSESFTYTANSGNAGKKALGDVGFAVEVKQDIVPSKALGGPDFTLKLSSGDRTVMQEWKNDKPWPETSSNGTTTSKLKSVTMPNK